MNELGPHRAKSIIKKHLNATLRIKDSTGFGGAEFNIIISKSKQEQL